MPIKTETTEKISKTKARNAAIAAKSAALQKIPKAIIDQLVPGPMSPAEFNNLSMALKKALVERVLGAELTHHLGYDLGPSAPRTQATTATAPAPRRCAPTTARCASRCRATAKAPSSRCSSASTSGASPASTTRSSPCTRAA